VRDLEVLALRRSAREKMTVVTHYVSGADA
jgi:hypothetical protein